MKTIPIVFPFALAVIIVATFFTGAYAISEAALNGEGPVAGDVLAASAGVTGTASPSADIADLDWFENAAILVCPLH